MNRIIHIVAGVVMVALMTACSSTRSLKKADSIVGMDETEYVENVISNAGGREALTAKMSLSIDLEGKGATKVNGTLRIKKGEVIQMSVAPFLGIEVARAEISPDGILVIDRMNKRYVEVSFAEVKALAHADLDFHTLQALFLNELFLPGKGDLTARDASSFKIGQKAEGVLLSVKKAKRFSYQFLTEAPEALLKESLIGLNGTPYVLRWKYADFRKLGQKQFPADMQLAFEGGKKPVKAAFALSRLSTDSDWEVRTEVSKKYEKVELEDILKLLLKK
ncbi:MAG: DUF4292 domain-containing protein [Bacteroidaceae bacterium]|nr:DUF4292 domain-containing protein [Bacteroidaceae bacterium]